MRQRDAPTPRSLVRATEIDVLAPDRVLMRRERYLVVRSPSNPGYYWGNLLVFDDPPGAGDGARWEALFAEELGDEELIRHTTFAWDRADGSLGAAQEEFVSRGYEVEVLVGLIAEPAGLRTHPRENRDVLVRALDHDSSADAALWDQVIELQIAGADARFREDVYREFTRRRIAELQELFRTGAGAWYVALDAAGGEVLGSCGIVVTGPRGRFQAVDTAAAHRRKGICSRLVVEAARRAAADHGARKLVICADPGYHALGIYESLGFVPAERAAGVCRQPPEDVPSAGRA